MNSDNMIVQVIEDGGEVTFIFSIETQHPFLTPRMMVDLLAHAAFKVQTYVGGDCDVPTQIKVLESHANNTGRIVGYGWALVPSVRDAALKPLLQLELKVNRLKLQQAEQIQFSLIQDPGGTNKVIEDTLLAITGEIREKLKKTFLLVD